MNKETQKAPQFTGAPTISNDQEWSVIGYLNGRATRACPMKLSGFKTMQYLGASGDYYHFVADGRTVLICTIKFKIP
jgi:hypothetical protein